MTSSSLTLQLTTQNETSKIIHLPPTHTNSYNVSSRHTYIHTKRHKTSSSWKQSPHSNTTFTLTTTRPSPSAENPVSDLPQLSLVNHTCGKTASTCGTSFGLFSSNPLPQPSSTWTLMPTSVYRAPLRDPTARGFIRGEASIAPSRLRAGRLQGQSGHRPHRPHSAMQRRRRRLLFADQLTIRGL